MFLFILTFRNITTGGKFSAETNLQLSAEALGQLGHTDVVVDNGYVSSIARCDKIEGSFFWQSKWNTPALGLEIVRARIVFENAELANPHWSQTSQPVLKQSDYPQIFRRFIISANPVEKTVEIWSTTIGQNEQELWQIFSTVANRLRIAIKLTKAFHKIADPMLRSRANKLDYHTKIRRDFGTGIFQMLEMPC